MSTRIPWDKYETAILIDAAVSVINQTNKQREAVKEVSLALRKKAVLSGISIDEIYRNENGITMQMNIIIGLLNNRPSGLHNASKLFHEMVELYKSNYEEYLIVLDEARMMIKDNNDFKERFINYLEKHHCSNINDVIESLSFVDEFAVSPNLLGHSIFISLTNKTIKLIENKIIKNKFFEIKYKSQMDRILNSVRELKNYVVEELSDNRFINTEDTGIQDFNVLKYDFKNHDSLSFTQPISASFEKTSITNVSSWRQVYIELLRLIYKKYPDALVSAADFFSCSSGVPLIGREAYFHEYRVPGEISEGLYSELNRSANDLMFNLKRIIVACDINFSSVIITYRKKDDNEQILSCNSINNVPDENKEQHDENITNDTLNIRLKSMAKVYDDPSVFSIERIKEMLGVPIEVEQLRKILNDSSFVFEVESDIYSFSNSKSVKEIEKEPVYDRDSIIRVLMLRYQNGMRFDSIDLENYRETFSDIIGDTLSYSDEELEKILRNCGVVYKERLFPAEGIVNSVAKEKLLEYIENNIADGKRVLYYKAILEDLSDVFSYCYNLSEPEMLKPYLEYVCESDKYYFYSDYLSADENAKIDPKSEIEDYLLSVGKPLSYDEIYEGLSHISKDIIYNSIKTNPLIILNEKEHYYHYNIFEFSYEDSDKISKYIDEEIEEDGYSIWTHVFSKIQDTMPLFIENNAYLSSLGIRNAISRKLAGRFNFDGEVVSHFGHALNMSDVYRLYGEHHAPFSDIDIYEFSKMVSNGCIYFDALSETCVRVSKSLFVPKTDVAFDIEATDKAISTYLTTGYMLVKDIDSFLVFPNVGYEWNEYLLESYLLFYSSKYALLNNGRSLNNVAGAVISKNGGFSNFADVCSDILANSECSLTKQNSLNFLAEMNLITRKSYSKIESVISIAKRIRNRKV